MTHPHHQAIWDATVDAVTGHADQPCGVRKGIHCPHMQSLADALSTAMDGRDVDEQIEVITWLIDQLAVTQLTNAQTESEDHGHLIAVGSGFDVSEAGGLLAGMLYLSRVGHNPELRDAALTILRTLGDTAAFRTVAAVMPALMRSATIRHRQMTRPVAGTR